MGSRLSTISTKTGDAGITGLGDNSRVSKSSLRIHALGDIDELNSNIGVLLCEAMPDAVKALLLGVQNELFNLGGELAVPGADVMKPDAVLVLDQAMEEYNGKLPPLEEFILPGGTRPAALAHVCRSVARRAERSLVALGNQEPLHEAPRQYINRLSDFLFVLARVLNRNGPYGSTGGEVYWQSSRLAKSKT